MLASHMVFYAYASAVSKLMYVHTVCEVVYMKLVVVLALDPCKRAWDDILDQETR